MAGDDLYQLFFAIKIRNIALYNQPKWGVMPVERSICLRIKRFHTFKTLIVNYAIAIGSHCGVG